MRLILEQCYDEELICHKSEEEEPRNNLFLEFLKEKVEVTELIPNAKSETLRKVIRGKVLRQIVYPYFLSSPSA